MSKKERNLFWIPRYLLSWIAALTFIGCSQNVAEWDAKKIESWIKNEWEMASVKVVENEDGTYSGTGTDKAGKKFTFKIQQKPDLKQLECARIDEQGQIVNGKAKRSIQ